MANLSWISSNPDYINQMIRNTQVTLSNNYNDLDNIPIIKITSTTNNPQKIWELKEGLYIINGVAQVDNNTSYEVSNLLISMTARLENGKYILSAFIPYLRGLFEYILKTNSTEYEQHQKIVLMIKNDTLALDNETIYTPIEDYHPATKKYVDDKANEIVAELDKMGVNKENLESLNKENRIRDIKLQALLSETSDRNITIEENVRYFDMPLSIDNGIVTINEIVGETLVNVCDQEESVAITKSYTVENENHIALQGEYDGSCRPVVYGNTLVNHNADWDDSLQTGVVTSASGIEDVVVEGIKGQEVSVVVEGNTVLNHALGKTSAVVSSIESENEGNYVDLTVANDMSSVVEIEGRTMVNLAITKQLLDKQSSGTGSYTTLGFIDLAYKLPSNTYTIIFTVTNNTLDAEAKFRFDSDTTSYYTSSSMVVPANTTGVFQGRFSWDDNIINGVLYSDSSSSGSISVSDIMIFKGDLTQTPHLIPSGYFEGLKSSYEYEVTEDGKYKVDVKVTGKNLLNPSILNISKNNANTAWYVRYLNVTRKGNYVIHNNTDKQIRLRFGKTSDNSWVKEPEINANSTMNFKITDDVTINWITLTYANGWDIAYSFTEGDFWIEEGTVATSYEPYFESTKTFYLNSPLLEGDKIVTKNGKVYHYHKMGKVVLDGSENWEYEDRLSSHNFARFFVNDKFPLSPNIDGLHIEIMSNNFFWDANDEHLNGSALLNLRTLYLYKYDIDTVADFKQWLQANPTTVVYELASPYYELIDEYNNTILNIPKNVAHLTHTSTVPVNNTTFTNYIDELNVLESNTQYRVMFDCDKASIPFTVTLGGTSQEVASKKSTHSLLITTPSELVDKNLVIDGIGRCDIDNIRIFKGDVEYDYVKGLWSGYEERKLNNIYKPMQYWTYVYPSNTIQIEHEHSQHIKVTPLTNTVTSFYVSAGYVHQCLSDLKPCTVYTFIADKCVGFQSVVLMQGNTSQSLSKNSTKLEKGVCKFETVYFDGFTNQLIYMIPEYNTDGTMINQVWELGNILILEGDWTDNPPTYEEVMANEGKYAVKVKLDTNATIFGKGGRL